MMKAAPNVPERFDDDNDCDERTREGERRYIVVLTDNGPPVIGELPHGPGRWEIPLALGSRTRFDKAGRPAVRVVWSGEARALTGVMIMHPKAHGDRTTWIKPSEAGELADIASRARALGIECDALAIDGWDDGGRVINVILVGTSHELDGRLGDLLEPHLRRWLLDLLEPRTVVPFRRRLDA